MIRVEETAVVGRPVAEVFRAASDPFRQLEWDVGSMNDLEALGRAAPLGRGARYRATFRGVGRVEYEYVEYEPDARFAHLARVPFGVMRHTFTFAAVPEGTRLTQTGDVAPNALGKVLAPIVRRALRKRFREIAVRLKRYLRAGGAENP
jgi:hypothetical protein